MQRAAVVHVAPGPRRVVVDEQPVLEVLPGVDEVQPQQLRGAARSGVLDAGADPHDVATDGDDALLVRRVAPDPSVELQQVHRVVVPVLDRDEVEGGAVADDDLHVGGPHRVPDVAQHHGGAGVRAQFDECVAELGVALAGRPVAGDGDHDGAVDLGLRGDGDDPRLRERRPGLRRHPVARGQHRTQPGVVTPDQLDGHRRGGVDLDGRARAGGEGPVVQPPEPLERGEPPDLLAAGGDHVVGEVEGAFGVQVGRDPVGGAHLHPGPDRLERLLGRAGPGLSHSHRGGSLSSGSDGHGRHRGRPLGGRRQPTAPSICSSMSRLSSSAYSIGSSRAMGSTKPRTIIAIASSSSMPRLMR